MDPITQTALGAAAAAIFSRRENVRLAVVVGGVAGAVPDLDVLIRSDADPLLALQYHRHFTHALVFAPVMGLLVALLFKALFFWKPLVFRELALFGIAGALTHGLLDACTSYGTSLYLPFSGVRESWDIISIIDPIFSLPLWFLVLFAFAWRWPNFARVAVVTCVFYLSLGVYQNQRAAGFVEELAGSRGHEPSELSVRPSFGNIVLWRLLYRSGDRYYIDAVRILPGSAPQHYKGSSVAAFTASDARERVGNDTVAARDIERFRHFSQGFLYAAPGDPEVVGDLRYSMFPDSVQPLWGIRVATTAVDRHVAFEHFRDPSKRSFGRLWKMIQGEAVEPVK